MDRINVTVQNQEGRDVVLRVGEAEKITYAKAINITGILAAPHQFYSGKTLDEKRCNIQIQKDKGIIELHILDTDPNSKSVITGKLTDDTFFKSWFINHTDKRWTVSEFLKHVKMQRVFFNEKSEADAIVDSLMRWNAKVELTIKQHQDTSGNSLSMLERKVGEIELKKKFLLTIPIFQGYPKQTFEVEIGFEPRGSEVVLYLFSNQLFELEINHRESLISEELAKFEGFKCSQVVLS